MDGNVTADQITHIATLPASADFRFARNADGTTIVVVCDPPHNPVVIYEDGSQMVISPDGTSSAMFQERAIWCMSA